MSDQTQEVVTLPIYTCKVARKGKGKQQPIEIRTIAEPVIVNGIAVRFDFSKLADVPLQLVIDRCEQILNNNRMLKEAVVRGTLDVERSAAIKENIEVDEVSVFLFENDYAETKEKAEMLAEAFHNNNVKYKNCGIPPESLDTFCNRLVPFITAQKEKGLWKASLAPAKVLETKTIEDVIQSSVVPPVVVTENSAKEFLGITK